MVKLLYTLSEDIRRKNLYIWDINKDSITEFTKLAIRQINIKGFVTNEKAYIGEWYMNRPIIGTQIIEGDDTAIIILSGKCDRSKIPVEIEKKAFLLSELLQIDDGLKEKRVYIYGAGVGGKDIYAKLKHNNIEVEAFCISQGCGDIKIEDKDVYQIDEVAPNNKNAFIVSVLHDNTKQDIIDVLDEYEADIYIRDFLDDNSILVISLFQSIHRAWREKKNIYVYTKSLGGYSRLIKSMLNIYGLEIYGYVYKEAKEELGIRDVCELAYEDISSIYVLVNDLDILEREKQIEVYEFLENVGLSMEKFNYAGFRQITTTDWRKKYQIVPDPLMAWSILYEDKNLPGVHIIGNRNEDNVRILILGGSVSTDGILRPTSWVREFYKKLVSHGVAVTIYDCAGPDEDVFQELLRFIRDGIHLKPHYVISMSGGNNEINRTRGIENKVILKHTLEWYQILAPNAAYACGLPVKETAFAYWYRIQKIIRAVAKLHGSQYYCFLQPMKAGKERLSVFERSLHFSGDIDNETSTFRTESRQDDFYMNLLSLFDEKEGMYIDNGHYSKEGNSILAEIVSQELLKELIVES